MWTGPSSSSSVRRATATASSGPAMSGSRSANSSPPRRATRSAGRVDALRRSADALEQDVAVVVAERVVDLLEAVEVHQQHADLAAAQLGGREGAAHALVQLRAVGQAGERVVVGLMGVDDRLPAAELNRRQRQPQQRDQSKVVGGQHQDDRHESHEDHRHRQLEAEVGADVGERAGAMGQRRCGAGERRVDEQEGQCRSGERGQVRRLEILQPILVDGRPGERVENRSGRGPRQRVLGGVEEDLRDGAAPQEVRAR